MAVIYKSNNKLSTIKNNILLYFLIIVFLIFSSAPVRFFSNINTFPNIALILIFYFLIAKRENINYLSFFIFGLFFDIFNNSPLGSTSLILLISSKIIDFLRTHLYTPNNFITIFRDFIIFSFLNSFMQWAIFGIYYKTQYSITNSLWQFFINVLFFGILYKALKKLEGILS